LHNKREERLNFFIWAIISNKSQEDKIIKSQLTSEMWHSSLYLGMDNGRVRAQMSTPVQPANKNIEPISTLILLRISRVTSQSVFGWIDSGMTSNIQKKFKSKTKQEKNSDLYFNMSTNKNLQQKNKNIWKSFFSR